MKAVAVTNEMVFLGAIVVPEGGRLSMNPDQLFHALTLIICDECGHAAHSKACEVERGDQFVEGQNGGAYMAQGPCGCTELTEASDGPAK